ncbi:MAG: transposase [Pseudomonadota bacterium]
MSRPIRLQFPGALYHVTARGNRRAPIFHDEKDRRAWIGILRDTCVQFHLELHAYCQMTNHFHLMLETPEGNLSRCMHALNGEYARYFNRRYKTVGHLFQGRFHAVLVQKDSYLLELTRYILLNPVRAGITREPDEWMWSSYHWMVSKGAPPWLHVDWLLSQFGSGRIQAIRAFEQFVAEGIGEDSPLLLTQHQTVLGDVNFVARYREGVALLLSEEVAMVQRRFATLSLCEFETRFPVRDEAMARAYWSTAYPMTDIARHFRVSAKTVGRAVHKYKSQLSDIAVC